MGLCCTMKLQSMAAVNSQLIRHLRLRSSEFSCAARGSDATPDKIGPDGSKAAKPSRENAGRAAPVFSVFRSSFSLPHDTHYYCSPLWLFLLFLALPSIFNIVSKSPLFLIVVILFDPSSCFL